MIRKAMLFLALGLVAVSAQAHDDRMRTAVGAGLGAAVGSAIGSELGGRNEAILGGAIGGAVGAAIATEERGQRDRHYRRAGRHDYWESGRHHVRKRKSPPSCPPGLAMQGRC